MPSSRSSAFAALGFLLFGCHPAPQETFDQMAARIDAPLRADQAIRRQELSQRRAVKGVSPSLQRLARDYIGKRLLDAESARYRSDFTTMAGNDVAVCGSVNAKNTYGGYVGFKRFYVEFQNGKPVGGDTVPLTPASYRMANVCGYASEADPTHHDGEPA